MQSVPQEILLYITEKVQDAADIVSLACTNSGFSFLLHYLYERNIRTENSSLVSWSIQHGRLGLLNRLLQHHRPDVNSSDEFCQTPVFYALLSRNMNICRAILADSRVEINRKNDKGQTPLVFALSEHATAMIPTLLQYNPDLDIQDNDLRTALWYATRSTDQKLVGQLLERGANVNIPDIQGKCPLNVAIDAGNIPILRCLLEYARECLYFRQTVSPICAAARRGCPEAVALLLQYGADINSRDRDGYTPLMVAMNSGHTHICIQLMENEDIDINVVDSNRNTALHQAVKVCWPIVPFLIDRRDIDLNAQNSLGMTPLSLALEMLVMPIVYQLLSKTNVDVNIQVGCERSTILHIAVSRREFNTVNLLLRRKDLNPDICDRSDFTALAYAAYWGDLKLTNILLERKDICVHKGIPPLWAASRMGHLRVAHRLLQVPGIDPNSSYKGLTPLLVAITYGNFDTARVLLTYSDGLKVNTSSESGETALTLTASMGRLDIVELLVSHHDMDISIDGEKALWKAANAGQLKVVRYLMGVPRLYKLLLATGSDHAVKEPQIATI